MLNWTHLVILANLLKIFFSWPVDILFALMTICISQLLSYIFQGSSLCSQQTTHSLLRLFYFHDFLGKKSFLPELLSAELNALGNSGKSSEDIFFCFHELLILLSQSLQRFILHLIIWCRSTFCSHDLVQRCVLLSCIILRTNRGKENDLLWRLLLLSKPSREIRSSFNLCRVW